MSKYLYVRGAAVSRYGYCRYTGTFLLALSVLVIGSGTSAAQQDSQAAKVYQQARQAFAQQDVDLALRLSAEAIELDPSFSPAWQLRGILFENGRQHKESIAAYSKAIELVPDDAATIDRRGSEYLLASEFDKAIADFDKAIELAPELERRHWKRGIAYYYAKKYAEGAAQFELYQTYDANDVENSVWRFLCMAKDVGVEQARKELLPIENDRRVPLMVVYAMFRAEAEPSDVMDAVKAGDPPAEELKRREFYAHLYLGLYYDALGQQDSATKHMNQAVERELPGYMWSIAKVHAEYLEASRKKK